MTTDVVAVRRLRIYDVFFAPPSPSMLLTRTHSDWIRKSLMEKHASLFRSVTPVRRDAFENEGFVVEYGDVGAVRRFSIKMYGAPGPSHDDASADKQFSVKQLRRDVHLGMNTDENAFIRVEVAAQARFIGDVTLKHAEIFLKALQRAGMIILAVGGFRYDLTDDAAESLFSTDAEEEDAVLTDDSAAAMADRRQVLIGRSTEQALVAAFGDPKLDSAMRDAIAAYRDSPYNKPL